MPIKLSSLGEIGVPRLNEIIVFRSNADALLYYKRPDSKIVPMSDLGKSGLYDFKETFVVNAIINKTGESSIILNLGTFTPKLMLFQEVTKVIGGGGGSASSSGGGGSGITGSGTTNYLAKFTSPSAIGDSKIFDNGTSVAIGNNAPTTSTAFEVKSTSGAILIPRMSTIQRNALAAIDGMILYDTTLPSFMGFAASTWYSFVGTSTTNTVNVIPKFATQSTLIDGSWAFSANDIIPLTANSNIGSASNYVGTIFLGSTLRYASNLIFSEAGTERGRWDGANLGIGIASPSALLHLAAGTATAGTAPIKLTSGIVNTISEVGAIEFTTDSLFFTGTTGATRKTISDFVYRGISAARTLDGSDEFVDCISGTFAVTLPTAVGFTKQYVIKNSGTGVITINTTSSQTIDGNASGTLNLNQYDTYILKSDGTNWVLTSGATVSSITDLDFHLVCSFKQLYNY